ncbi:ankyrin repeat domain-containing protein 34B [Platichthys flesus]|uniref:ankyrin repeat domain-containing protein 34B n=1 Tax=Platichthys flesus TaxID=8260 RepID=UPI002DBE885A|nr:ankyrin repeat domain-containing protein 34B [Platichthys flesus]
MGDPLFDCSPLISAAASGKLRLVRLLVDGGAQVNGRCPQGETALLAACKALRGEAARPETVKLLTYLLHNKANPNVPDRAGRTALMYACMERAGAEVASTLLSAGADPSMEDFSGASALVYAMNAQHQPTLEVLMDACRARGRDIIIITTEVGVGGGPVTRRYLNVPPSPNNSPVSCMSPSDIVLKTSSPSSPEGENIFNFTKRGSSSSRRPSCELSPLSRWDTPRHRALSEPWLAIHNLACLNRAYEEGTRERSRQEQGGREDLGRGGGGSEDERREDEDEESHFHQFRVEERRVSLVHRGEDRHGGEIFHRGTKDFPLRVSQSGPPLTEASASQATVSRMISKRSLTAAGSALDQPTQRSSVTKLPVCPSPHSHLRRNTLLSVTVVPPPLHLPPLVHQSDSHLQVPSRSSLAKSRSMVFLPHPPSTPSSLSGASRRRTLLPPLPLSHSLTSLVAPGASCCGERSRRSLRRHSVQLDQIRGDRTNHMGLHD